MGDSKGKGFKKIWWVAETLLKTHISKLRIDGEYYEIYNTVNRYITVDSSSS